MFDIKGLDDTLKLLNQIKLEQPVKCFLKNIPYKIISHIESSDYKLFENNSTWHLIHERGYSLSLAYEDGNLRKMLNLYYIENKNLKNLYNSTSTTMLSFFVAKKESFDFEPAWHELYKLTRKNNIYYIEKYTSSGKEYQKKLFKLKINKEKEP